jgi:4-hydroxyacetophenone monooxygenase
VIVSATGFEVAKYLWPSDYIGTGGTNIHDLWSTDGPRAYISMMAPGFPNMFMLYGPNSQPLSGGTGLPTWYTVWSAYVARCIVRMVENGMSRVEVRPEAFQRYNEALDKEAAKLLLLQDEGAPEKNYYVNEFGRLQVNAPWYGPEYHRMCTIVDWDDLQLR